MVDRVGKGIRGAPRDALLVDGIDETSRGRVFGFHRAMDTLGAVVGPLIGLAGYELLDHEIPPLLYIAIVPAVLSVALVALVRERPRPVERARRPPTRRPSWHRQLDAHSGVWGQPVLAGRVPRQAPVGLSDACCGCGGLG